MGMISAIPRAGKIAEDTASCSIIAREVGAIQQLILMALSDNEVVVQQACKILGKRCVNPSHLKMRMKGLGCAENSGLAAMASKCKRGHGEATAESA